MRVLAAVDKFRGTVTAVQAARAVAEACSGLGHECVEMPMADGGEGTLDVLGGANRLTVVEGPLGSPVEAAWRLTNGTAVIEMARASGLQLVGGAAGNDALAASTIGTGQLIAAALDAGAQRVVVCVGGSATTDGGLGAVQVLQGAPRLREVDLIVACDVQTLFVDAAAVFAPQKGASPAHVQFLVTRLTGIADHYRDALGCDVRSLPGAGAAGGLAGGLAALGAKLKPGFDLVANEVGFHSALAECDVVITGEGRLDDTSFTGKVVGEVARHAADCRASAHGTAPGSIAICGSIDSAASSRAAKLGLRTIGLFEVYGGDALNQPMRCITHAAVSMLATSA